MTGVSASPRKESGIVDLTYSGTDPVFVQRALNAMTLSFRETSAIANHASMADRKKFLDAQLKRSDSLVQARRAQLADYRTRTRSFDPTQKGAIMQSTLADIRTRRDEMVADREVFSSLLNGALAARKSGEISGLRALMGSPDVLNNVVMATLYSKLQKATAARDNAVKGPFAQAATNPDVERLNAQIGSLTASVIDAAKSMVSTLDARIAALNALDTKTSQEVAVLPVEQAEQEKLQQEQSAAQRAADELQWQQQRAAIVDGAQSGKIEVIDLVDSPPKMIPVRSATRKLIFNGLAGFAIAVMLIILFDEFNTKLRRKADIEKLLSLPTLGSIPSLAKTNVRGPARMLSRIPTQKSPGGRSLAAVTASPAFESYRSMRTSLIFPCDLRRGSLHKVFDVPRLPGLTHAIAGGLDLQSVVKETSVPNLSVVTTGMQPPNPGEFLSSNKLRELLASAQTEYDLVLIDTPPVTAAADASMVASITDGVILLVRVGNTTKRAAKTAQERLQLSGARILGTVLNDPQELLQSSGEYYSYYYEYATQNEAVSA